MSDHWEFFESWLGDSVAFIFYDHGIRDTISAFSENQCVRIELTLKNPSPQGLPFEDEIETLRAIENELDGWVTSNSGLYIGRVTGGGHRVYLSYLGLDALQIESFVTRIRQQYGYDVAASVEQDPEKLTYWEGLFPSDDDWQWIEDCKVVERLSELGDPLEVPRRVDHWAYFSSKTDAEKFAERVKSDDFQIEEVRDPSPNSTKFQVSFHRVDLPQLNKINEVTAQIRAAVSECNGQYDGWATHALTQK